MACSTMLHVRVDDDIKTQASEALAAMGLSVSDAVRILLKRVVNDQAFPLELKVPNAQAREAMEEACAMAKARTARFDCADALIDDLEKARQQSAGAAAQGERLHQDFPQRLGTPLAFGPPRPEAAEGGDFLLIYRPDGNAIVFVRTGTHSGCCPTSGAATAVTKPRSPISAAASRAATCSCGANAPNAAVMWRG